MIGLNRKKLISLVTFIVIIIGGNIFWKTKATSNNKDIANYTKTMSKVMQLTAASMKAIDPRIRIMQGAR